MQADRMGDGKHECADRTDHEAYDREHRGRTRQIVSRLVRLLACHRVVVGRQQRRLHREPGEEGSRDAQITPAAVDQMRGAGKIDVHLSSLAAVCSKGR